MNVRERLSTRAGRKREERGGGREREMLRCNFIDPSTDEVLSRVTGPALFRSRTNGRRFTEGVHAGALRAREGSSIVTDR